MHTMTLHAEQHFLLCVQFTCMLTGKSRSKSASAKFMSSPNCPSSQFPAVVLQEHLRRRTNYSAAAELAVLASNILKFPELQSAKYQDDKSTTQDTKYVQ